MSTVQWLASAAQDVRQGVRAMRRSPTSTAVALVTLAIGIGGNAASSQSPLAQRRLDIF